MQHIATIKGAEFQKALAALKAHLQQKLDHAKSLPLQIDFDGRVPTNRIASFTAETGGAEALAADLRLEAQQPDRYRQRVAQATSLGLPEAAEALAPVDAVELLELHHDKHHAA